MITKLLALCALGATAWLLGGCVGPGVATVKTNEARSFPDEVDTRIQYRAAALSRNVFVEVIESTVSEDLLRIQVRFRNLTSRDREYWYQIVWIDESGFEMDIPRPKWERITLMPYEEKAVSKVAYSPNATDFTIKISREPGE